ncbi:MepB family protein (plasmid) [Leptospira sp. WS60.C2]
MPNTSLKTDMLPSSLNNLKLLLSKNCEIEIKNYEREKESSNYNAALFDLGSKKAIFREAKITPKKIGLFVTLWKRNKYEVTTPFHETDSIDVIIIEVKELGRLGHFIFSKSILVKNGIISTSTTVGKRGFRIYPPWVLASNKQASQSQLWQSRYFFEQKRMTEDKKSYLRELIKFDSKNNFSML